MSLGIVDTRTTLSLYLLKMFASGKRELRMDIFYDGFRTCKKCKRDLPNNSLHFPTDKSCKDGLRSVCRECNPKYGRFLELNHRTNTKWSNEDLEKLKSVYKDYTNEEIIKNFFPDRTLRSLEVIAHKYKFNHKTQETIDRASKNGAIKNSEKQKGKIFSEEHKRHISDAQKKRYESLEQREIASKNAIKRGLGKGDLAPLSKNPLYGEKNGRWKGGASELIEQLRRDIINWKKSSAEFCDYKCIFTGGRFKNIHHIISFNSLVEQSLHELKLNRRENISQYSSDEYNDLKNKVIEVHMQTFYGACMCEELHTLFHKEFTYYDSTLDDFIKFSERIIDGYYDDFFENNNLSKSINYEYIEYLKVNNQK